jgi:hypothetical protein
MVPFTLTGVYANQAALNCLRVVALKGALGDRFENRPQLLKNPTLSAELRPVTELMHCNMVVSKSIANEMAEVLIPLAMVAVIGRTKVSPTFKHEEFDPIVAVIF